MGFRKHITKNKTVLLAGKDAENNEELVNQAEKDEWLLHTLFPGSPFVNIKGKAKKGDVKEAAIFCAKYSREWKKSKKDVEVHKFKKKDTRKSILMKKGTFGVKDFKKIRVRKEDIIKFEKI